MENENKNIILDCHIHYSLPVDPQELIDIMEYTKSFSQLGRTEKIKLNE